MIATRIQYASNMVERPLDALLPTLEYNGRESSIGQDIIQVYDNSGGSFLILGEAGSGKTTLLLKLAEELIGRAQNPSLPERGGIPIYLNLSTWSVRKDPLKDWIIGELDSSYNVSAQLGSYWVEHNDLVLLLDGLDEVQNEFQLDCIEKINEFRKAHYPAHTIITSRLVAYENALKAKMKLFVPNAVMNLPLSKSQVDEYLVSLGEEYERVRAFINTDLVSMEIAQYPLFLNIAAMAYRDVKPDDVVFKSQRQWTDRLFDAYTARMFIHKKMHGKYEPEAIINGLNWLARLIINRKSLRIFHIEDLQPKDLSSEGARRTYSLIVNSLLWLFVAPPVGAAAGLGLYFIGISTLNSVLLGALTGITAGLAMWILERGLFGIRYRALLGCVVGITIGHLFWTFTKDLFLSSIFGSLVGMFVTLLYKPIGINKERKEIDDALSYINMKNLNWSLGLSIVGFFRRLPMGIAFGVVSGLGIGQVFGWQRGLTVGIGFALAVALLAGMAFGNRDVDIIHMNKPNEGTWKSLENALRLGLVSGLSVGLILGYLVASLSNPVSGVVCGALFFLAVFIIDGFISGGRQVVQHLLVRILLRLYDGVPMNLVELLNRAVYHIFLLNVGNGYVFKHGLFIDYFASKRQT